MQHTGCGTWCYNVIIIIKWQGTQKANVIACTRWSPAHKITTYTKYKTIKNHEYKKQRYKNSYIENKNARSLKTFTEVSDKMS